MDSVCQLDEDQSIATLQEESMLSFRGGNLGMTSSQSTWQTPKSNGWNGTSANAFLEITEMSKNKKRAIKHGNRQ
jgi:hypothetical protein